MAGRASLSAVAKVELATAGKALDSLAVLATRHARQATVRRNLRVNLSVGYGRVLSLEASVGQPGRHDAIVAAAPEGAFTLRVSAADECAAAAKGTIHLAAGVNAGPIAVLDYQPSAAQQNATRANSLLYLVLRYSDPAPCAGGRCSSVLQDASAVELQRLNLYPRTFRSAICTPSHPCSAVGAKRA